MRAVVVLCLAAACGSRASEPPPPDPTPAPAAAPRPARPAATVECAPEPELSIRIPLAEASGAVYVGAADGRPAHLLVISDSGNRGAYVELDPDSGEVVADGALPLDPAASDDLEGLALSGDTYYALTSSGWMRHYRRSADGYRRTADAYPIGEPPMVCESGRAGNCARDYEGLCLGGDGPCAGFALSRADGALYCLIRDGDRMRVDPERRIDVARRATLSGCSFAPDGSLWVGSNLFGLRAVYRITGTADPGSARIEEIGALGPGFPEAIVAAPDGALWRFSDTNSAPSLVDRYRCR